MPDSATYKVFPSGLRARPKGMIPRRFLSFGSGLSMMFFTSLLVFTSITETQSLLPLLTNTKLALATTELGLEPPTAGIPSNISPI